MAPTLPHRPLGRTGLSVTPLCAGGSVLASMPEVFGYEVPAEQAVATVRAVLAGPVNFLDTANAYGAGASEERIGAAIAERGGLPEGFVLATKVDRDLGTGDYGGPRVRQSVLESQQRLGLERFPLLYLHDPHHVSFEEATGPGGAVEALVALAEEGVAEHLGVAGGSIELLCRYLDLGVFEVVLTHNRYTLLDRSAEPLLEVAAERGIGVVNAAPFGGGLLARGTASSDRYAYRPAAPVVLERVRQMEALCAARGVSLRAAALHISLREPRVASTVVGTASPEHLAELVALAASEIPAELLAELEPLAAPREEWLG